MDLLKDTPYWQNGDLLANSGPRMITKGIQTNPNPPVTSKSVSTGTAPSVSAPRARRTGLPSATEHREPLSVQSPNVIPPPSNVTSSFCRSGKENLNPVRSSLMRRKEARLAKEASIIDLTGDESDGDSVPKQVPVVSEPTKSETPSISSDIAVGAPIPWKLGNVPSLLWSVKNIKGEKVKDYETLKSYAIGHGAPEDKYATKTCPPCPPLPPVPSDPRSDSARDQPGPSGLLIPSRTISRSIKPQPIITLSDSDDDDTPLQALVSNAKAALQPPSNSSNALSLPKPSSLSPTVDPSIRKSGRKRRMYAPPEE